MEGVFGRIEKRGGHRIALASPTGMKEVTGRNEAEDSRLPLRITSSLRTTRIPLRVALAAVDDLSLRTVDKVNLKEKEKKGEGMFVFFLFVINVTVVP